jgi:hypothetical protein
MKKIFVTAFVAAILSFSVAVEAAQWRVGNFGFYPTEMYIRNVGTGGLVGDGWGAGLFIGPVASWGTTVHKNGQPMRFDWISFGGVSVAGAGTVESAGADLTAVPFFNPITLLNDSIIPGIGFNFPDDSTAVSVQFRLEKISELIGLTGFITRTFESVTN